MEIGKILQAFGNHRNHFGNEVMKEKNKKNP